MFSQPTMEMVHSNNGGRSLGEFKVTIYPNLANKSVALDDSIVWPLFYPSMPCSSCKPGSAAHNLSIA